MVFTTHEAAQSKSFFLILQSNSDLDLRDNRGKKHDIAVVLLGIFIGLLRKRDGKLSSIHRSMVNTHAPLKLVLKSSYNIDYHKVISRSHLPILLQKVCIETLGKLLFEHYGIELSAEEKAWFAMDGKELRGTIQTGSTRGEAIVQAVRHGDRNVFCQGYYNGSKESEQPVVQHLLKQNDLASQGITIDALHFNPATLNYIQFKGGSYIVSLKGNQEEMSLDMEKVITTQNADFKHFEEGKGHGREETRAYYCKNISGEYFDKRWKFAGLTTLIMVKRTRIINSSGKYSEDVSYYMSNENPTDLTKAKHLFEHIRLHWSVEVNNYIRDVTLQEDALQTKFKDVARPISLLRTLLIKVLQKCEIKNIAQKLEEFMDDFQKTLLFLKSVNVL
jgi:predicted transposase YbfD/YdcC